MSIRPLDILCSFSDFYGEFVKQNSNHHVWGGNTLHTKYVLSNGHVVLRWTGNPARVFPRFLPMIAGIGSTPLNPDMNKLFENESMNGRVT